MCLTGCNTPPSPSSGMASGSPAVPPSVVPCTSCSVSVIPNQVRVCGASATVTLIAVGTPPGGGFAWRSGDAAIASVSSSGAAATVTGVAQGSAIITVTYTPSGCGPCTAQATAAVCTCTPDPSGRHFYSTANKPVANLIGAKAKIKTRWGKLCCEGCATSAAFSSPFVNVSDETGPLHWAQTGFNKERTAGQVTPFTCRFAESMGDTYHHTYDTAHPPTEGSEHVYQVDLNESTGTWTFSMDGTVWETYQDPAWVRKKGNTVQWTGEIINREDDMAGTSGDKCHFTECQYRTAGQAYQDAAITAGQVRSDDNAEWGATRISGSALDIWDKKPVP